MVSVSKGQPSSLFLLRHHWCIIILAPGSGTNSKHRDRKRPVGADRGDHRNGRHLLKGNHGTIVIVIIVSHISSGAVFLVELQLENGKLPAFVPREKDILMYSIQYINNQKDSGSMSIAYQEHIEWWYVGVCNGFGWICDGLSAQDPRNEAPLLRCLASSEWTTCL